MTKQQRIGAALALFRDKKWTHAETIAECARILDIPAKLLILTRGGLTDQEIDLSVRHSQEVTLVRAGVPDANYHVFAKEALPKALAQIEQLPGVVHARVVDDAIIAVLVPKKILEANR